MDVLPACGSSEKFTSDLDTNENTNEATNFVVDNIPKENLEDVHNAEENKSDAVDEEIEKDIENVLEPQVEVDPKVVESDKTKFVENEEPEVVENDEPAVVENDEPIVVENETNDKQDKLQTSDDHIVVSDGEDVMVVPETDPLENAGPVDGEPSTEVKNSDPVICLENKNVVELQNGGKLGVTPVMVCVLEDNIKVLESLPELTEEEKLVRARIFQPGNTAVQFTKIHCTACNKHLGSSLEEGSDRFVHPLLKVIVCKSCLEFYTSGEFEKDEDGSELYCRWCGQGGKVLCCTKCEYVFCIKCIKHNFGRKRLDVIKELDDWLCFACEPSQSISQRVICRTFFEYIRNESRRVLETKDVANYTTDYTFCCRNKKRKMEDGEFDVNEELANQVKRKRPSVPKNTQKRDQNQKVCFNQQEEEEVVCAPDLLMLMSNDEDMPEESPASAMAALAGMAGMTPMVPMVPMAPPTPLMLPPLVSLNAPMIHVPEKEVQFVGQSRMEPMSVNSFRPLTPKVPPVILRNSLSKPPPMTRHINPMVLNGISNSKPVGIPKPEPPRLVAGMKHQWFETATKVTAQVHSKLSYNIALLSKQQSTASSVEELAKVHNKLQEVLSQSINSLIQVRRNLRNEFLAGLNNLKFARKEPKPLMSPTDEVIVVNDHPVISPPIVVSSSSTAGQEMIDLSSSVVPERPRGYLKVRTVAQLAHVPAECITIPDDDIERISVSSKEMEKNDGEKLDALVNGDSNKENVENFGEKEDVVAEKEVEREEPPIEMTPEIKKALFESKLEKLVSDNLQYNVVGLSQGELKRMLSARVYASSKYIPKLRRKNLELSLSKAQDFEEMLEASVVEPKEREVSEAQDFEEILSTAVVEKRTQVPATESVEPEDDLYGF